MPFRFPNAGLVAAAGGCFALWLAGLAGAQSAEPPPPPPSGTQAPSPSTPQTSVPAPDPKAAPSETRGVPTDDGPEPVETQLTLVDGSRVTGVLVERSADKIVLVINDVRTPYAAESVAQVETLPPVAVRYRQMRAQIGDGDIDQRLLLVSWLRNHHKYQLALDEVSDILGRDPKNPEAKQLRTWLTEQLKLQARPGVPRVAHGETVAPPEPGAPRAAQGFDTLSPEQINIIRVFEVDLADPPRMMIDRDVITALINRYATDPLIPATREGREALYRRQPAQILDLMFRLRAREFYGRVQVMQDPRSMKLFRERVHATWLINSCATSACHGGEHAGRLFLASRQPNSDATVYTNFLILDRFRLAGGGPRDGVPDGAGHEGRPLIDYDDPARSPLLHLALSKTESLFPHPPVAVAGGRFKPITPVFNNTNDRRYQEAVEWIRSMYMPRPDYPVQYTPPAGNVQAVLGEARGSKKDKQDPLSGRR